MSIFCSLVTEDCNIFHSQSTVKTLESASQLPYRHMWRQLSYFPRAMVDSRKVKVDFSLEDMDLSEFKGKATYDADKGICTGGEQDLRFHHCISHRLRRSVDWMSVRTSIRLNQRMRDSHSVHRRRKMQLCRHLVILESYRLWISSIVC